MLLTGAAEMTRKLPAASLPSSSKISLKSSSSEKFDVDMDGPEVSPEAAVERRVCL